MERDQFKTVFYAFVMDSLNYTMLSVKLDICFAVGIMNGY